MDGMDWQAYWGDSGAIRQAVYRPWVLKGCGVALWRRSIARLRPLFLAPNRGVMRSCCWSSATQTISTGSYAPADQTGRAGHWRRLVIMGDSLAAGFGEPVAGLEIVGWGERLAKLLRHQQPYLHYTNLAISGLTTQQIAQTQLKATTTLKPDLIVLVAGANDFLSRQWDREAFRTTYATLLTDLLGTGAMVVTTTWHNASCAVPMPPALARQFSRRFEAGSAIVREVSEQRGALCVDFWQWPDLLDAQCYSSDRLHPNACGYLRVAEVLVTHRLK